MASISGSTSSLALGKHQLAKLTAQHIQAFLASKLEAGYAPSTVEHMFVVLHDALDDAVRLGLVPRNVADMVKAPRVKRHEFAIYSEEQARRLLDAVAGHRLDALLVLALTTGMREGELDTLQWRDVDLGSAVRCASGAPCSARRKGIAGTM